MESPSSKLTYGTMMFVRVVLVQDAADYLKKAVTIAVRYSCVRRQSQLKAKCVQLKIYKLYNIIVYYTFSEPEAQIIDYITQQYKLFPHISSYFAFRYCATWIWDMYNNVSSELEAGQLDQLPEV